MKLYLIRHGQTLWNQEGKIQGKTDIPLNDEGRKQAGLLAEAMENRPVGAVYSSPLKRAFETASCVAEQKGLSVVSLDGLREVDFGLWEGITWKEIEKNYHEDFVLWDKNPAEHTPTGGERKRGLRRQMRESHGADFSQDSGRPGCGGCSPRRDSCLCRAVADAKEPGKK